MIDLLRKCVFGALYFSPKFLITCQIPILVRFQMIQTAFLVRILSSYWCLKLYESCVFKNQSDERIRTKNASLNHLKTHQNHNLTRDQKFRWKIERTKNAIAKYIKHVLLPPTAPKKDPRVRGQPYTCMQQMDFLFLKNREQWWTSIDNRV